MPIICPAVLAPDLESYRSDLANVSSFAERIQIDIADGEFASNKTVNLAEVHWPDGIVADLHLMIQNPFARLPEIISLNPDLAIIHAEADGDLKKVIETLREVDINTGLALLQKTKPEDIEELIKMVDHVLVFTGELGHYGGKTDMNALKKIPQLININSELEIGVDGGINDQNVREVVQMGADVLNVGSFIQKADNPKNAYDKLMHEANKAVENES